MENLSRYTILSNLLFIDITNLLFVIVILLNSREDLLDYFSSIIYLYLSFIFSFNKQHINCIIY